MSNTQSHTPEQGAAPQPAFLSSDPSMAIQEMMETIDVLRNVYVRETDALENANTQVFLEMQEEKLKAARNYQAGIQEFMKRREEMKAINPGMKKQLEEMQKEFSELAKQNLEALQRMQRCVDRLGNTLRNAAKDAANKDRTFSYGESGQIQSDNKRPVSTGSISETA